MALREPGMRTGLTVIATLGLGTLASGCFGGQSTDAGVDCKVIKTPLSDDSEPVSGLGFAPADVLEWAEGEQTADARFFEPPSGVAINVAPHDTRVQFVLERGEGAALDVTVESPCATRELQIPITLVVTSDDGALAESAQGVLSASRADFARVWIDLDPGALEGELELRTENPQLRRLSSGLSIVLTPDGNTGELRLSYERHTGDSTTLERPASLMQWPAANACGGERVALELAADDPEWVEPLAEVRQARWVDDSDGVTAEAAAADVTIDLAGVLCEGDTDVVAPASVNLRMRDGGSEVQLPAALSRTEGRLELTLDSNVRAGDRPAAFVERFSDFGLELDDYAHVAMELTLTLGSAEPAGVFAVVGYDGTCQPVCTSIGCTGCGPLARSVLLELRLPPAP